MAAAAAGRRRRGGAGMKIRCWRACLPCSPASPLCSTARPLAGAAGAQPCCAASNGGPFPRGGREGARRASRTYRDASGSMVGAVVAAGGEGDLGAGADGASARAAARGRQHNLWPGLLPSSLCKCLIVQCGAPACLQEQPLNTWRQRMAEGGQARPHRPPACPKISRVLAAGTAAIAAAPAAGAATSASGGGQRCAALHGSRLCCKWWFSCCCGLLLRICCRLLLRQRWPSLLLRAPGCSAAARRSTRGIEHISRWRAASCTAGPAPAAAPHTAALGSGAGEAGLRLRAAAVHCGLAESAAPGGNQRCRGRR